jgi:hypothetical protein
MKSVSKTISKEKLPEIFKPILWSFEWKNLDIWKDKEDIILAALNYGELEHLRWIIETYGKDEIKKVLSRRLKTEVYPESRNLARVLFGVQFKNSREEK